MSTLTRCENGHFYDSDKHRKCPYCEMKTGAVGDTVDVHVGGVSSNGNQWIDNLGETIGYYSAMPNKPVVGWLVVIEGSDEGTDFRLCSGRNYIGRGEGMDIRLKDDASVSRSKHAIVVFDPLSQRTLCQAGESRELFYLNDTVVMDTVELKQGDVLTVGKTKLMFVPFCGSLHTWKTQV